jgi:hypothetical protein
VNAVVKLTFYASKAPRDVADRLVGKACGATKDGARPGATTGKAIPIRGRSSSPFMLAQSERLDQLQAEMHALNSTPRHAIVG